MGLFSRVRRVNGAGLPAGSAPATDPTIGLDLEAASEPIPRASHTGAPRTAAPNVSSLRDGLQHLYSIRPSRGAFAEAAVTLIAKGAGVKAVALLGYEPRGNRMHLLAQAGLDAEAIQALSGDS